MKDKRKVYANPTGMPPVRVLSKDAHVNAAVAAGYKPLAECDKDCLHAVAKHVNAPLGLDVGMLEARVLARDSGIPTRSAAELKAVAEELLPVLKDVLRDWAVDVSTTVARTEIDQAVKDGTVAAGKAATAKKAKPAPTGEV
jgi:hypothetical protein